MRKRQLRTDVDNLCRFLIPSTNFSLPLPASYSFRITSKNSNLDFGELTWTLFAYFQFCFRGVLILLFLSFRSRKFVTPLLEFL